MLLLPYIVGFFSDSTSSYSETIFGIGGGRYVYHDCSGTHKQGFGDAGIYFGKKFDGPFRLGLGAGAWTTGQKGSYVFGYPDLALDWKNFSIGTSGIRIGSRDEFYFESKVMDQPPFFTGKGAIRIGFGGKLDELDTRLWIGSNVFPYNTAGFATQIEFPIGERQFLFFNGRFGKDRESKIEEYGFSVGTRIISF